MELVKGHQELFNGQLFDIWRNEQHEVFMTTEQLAQGLGYKSKKGVESLVLRNPYLKKREFSVTLKLKATDGKQYDTRVFTFDGIQEIGMIAPNSANARKFREWIRTILKAYYKGELVKAKEMAKATVTRRTLTEAINESPHFEQKNHIIFSNLLAKLVSNGKYNSVVGMRKALGRPKAKLKQMLDSPEDLQSLQKYEASITNLLDLGFDYHEIAEFLTKEKAGHLPR